MPAILKPSVRIWTRPSVLAALAGLLALTLTPHLFDHFSSTAGGFYLVAIIGALLSIAISGQLGRVAWFHSEGSRAACLILPLAGMASMVALGQVALSPVGAAPVPSLGLLHIAALALVLHRTPWTPASRAWGLLLIGLVVPALVPALRPLLDAGPSFRDPHLPSRITALAPILSLIVLALALPGRSRGSIVRNTVL